MANGSSASSRPLWQRLALGVRWLRLGMVVMDEHLAEVDRLLAEVDAVLVAHDAIMARLDEALVALEA